MSIFDQESSPDDSVFESSAPLKSELHEKAIKQAKETMRRQEAEHVIKMSLKAGIPKELIGWKGSTLIGYAQKNLNQQLYKPKNPNPNVMANKICDIKSWTRKKLVIFVDGGTKEARVGFSHLILARAIIGNFLGLGKLGITIPYSVLNVKFNGFDKDRQELVANLSDLPALYISEVNDKCGFRSSSDGGALMDQLIESRKGPTIFSLSTSPENFEGHTTYGTYFRDLVEAVKVTVCNDSVWRFSLKTDKPCEDIMGYNALFTEVKKKVK